MSVGEPTSQTLASSESIKIDLCNLAVLRPGEAKVPVLCSEPGRDQRKGKAHEVVVRAKTAS